ncbi:MAG TPA: hypothetical protein PK367_02620 [Candidatus Paceibacterota bacterium]|nr:hypothetical protein [Candidatus Paceibacterota bacterium]
MNPYIPWAIIFILSLVLFIYRFTIPESDDRGSLITGISPFSRAENNKKRAKITLWAIALLILAVSGFTYVVMTSQSAPYHRPSTTSVFTD